MTNVPTCSVCGRRLPEAPSNGPCHACLLKLALTDPELSVADDLVTLELASSGAPSNESSNPAAAPDGNSYGWKIEGFDITGRLGAGGMGVVLRAVQRSTHRAVALKVLGHAAFASDESRVRFEREIELTAALEHAHIARVYESGSCDGVCYYAMELIEGQPLDRYVEKARSTRVQVLELVRAVCIAVQHAHQRGIIHRDLKPSNILVDASGEPHVLDFGLAKALGGGAAPDVSVTGEVSGTLAYMSPEQAAGLNHKLDTRTDVYSLGVILYRLLTGKPPHDLSGSYGEVLQRIAHDEVRRPRSADPKLDSELESLLLYALAKEPDDRYPAAGALADDIGNYLRGDPLAARSATTFYFLRKRLAKHKGRVTVAAAVTVALFGTAVAGFFQVRHERNTAVAERNRADIQTVLARENERRAVAETARAVEQTKRADDKAREAQREARRAETEFAQSMVSQGNAYAAMVQWDSAGACYLIASDRLSALGEPALKADFGLLEAFQKSPPELISFPAGNGRISRCAVSPDGRLVASCQSWNSDCDLWDTSTGVKIRSFKLHHGAVSCVAFSPDGRTLLTGSVDKTLKHWDVADGSELRTFNGHTATVASVAFFPSGDKAASAAEDGTVIIWALDGSAAPRKLAGHTGPVDGIAGAPDGRHVLTVGQDGTLRLWDTQGPGRLERLIYEGLRVEHCVAFSPDGRLAVCGGNDAHVTLWDLSSGQCLRTFGAYIADAGVFGIGFHPDGKTFLANGPGGTVVKWDVATGQRVRTFYGHSDTVRTFSVSQDGSMAVTGGDDKLLHAWHVGEPEAPRRLDRWGAAHATRVSGDGLLLVERTWDNRLILADAATGQILREADPRASRFTDHGQALAMTRSASLAAVGGTDGPITLWEPITGRLFNTLAGHAGGVKSLAFSHDGKTLLSAGDDQRVKLWDVTRGTLLRTFVGHTGPVETAVFSPDETRILSAGHFQKLTLWDAATAVEIRTFDGPPRRTKSVVFSANGQTAVSSDLEKAARLWDVSSGKEIRTFRGHTSGLYSAAFSPDGHLVVTTSNDRTIRLWDAQTGDLLRTLDDAPMPGQLGSEWQNAYFSPDGNTLFATASGVKACAWDLAAPARYRDFAARLPAAIAAVGHGNDPAGLKVLGEWYAFRGRWEWAADLLDRARAGGAAVSPLLLARCDWQAGRLRAARSAFDHAIAAKEAPEPYLRMCCDAIDRAAPTSTTSR